MAVDYTNTASKDKYQGIIYIILSCFCFALMSYFLLKEKVNKVEGVCVIVAFIGTLFIIKPSFQMQFLYAMIGVLGGLGAGVAHTYVRKLGLKGECGQVIVYSFFV